VRRGRAAGGDAPAFSVEEQRCLRLSTGQAELTSVRFLAPRRSVGPQGAQPIREVAFAQPIDRALRATDDLCDAIRRDESNRSSAVLANVSEEREGVSRRNLKPARPPFEDDLVVRKEPPRIRLDDGVTVLQECE